MNTHPSIGHVHLKVSDLSRSIAFYRDVLGMALQQMYGDSAAFLSYGEYHHHIGLNVWQSRNGPPPPAGTTGLFHVAILYPTRRDLAMAYQRLLDRQIQLTGAADHGVSEALYLNDPDRNGLELYWDRPRESWPRVNGQIAMITEPLDLEDLLQVLRA